MPARSRERLSASDVTAGTTAMDNTQDNALARHPYGWRLTHPAVRHGHHAYNRSRAFLCEYNRIICAAMPPDRDGEVTGNNRR